MHVLLRPMADERSGMADTNDIRYAMVGRDTSEIHALATGESPRTLESSETEMLGALLKEAGRVLCKYCLARGYKQKLLYREVREWVLSDDYESPFSFVNVCNNVGINPDYARKKWRPYLYPTERRRRDRMLRIYPLGIVRL